MANEASLKIDPSDPRSRLHFIKYVTKDKDTTKCWECGICGKDFKHQYTLVRHLPVHTDERKFKCDKCEKAFRQLSTLTQHKASKHTSSKPYVCEICTKSFSRVSILINHKKIHQNGKDFQCTICEKAFHQKTNLKMHMNIHTNERPYSCSICQKGFNQKSNLAVHQRACGKKNNSRESNIANCKLLPATNITEVPNIFISSEQILDSSLTHVKESPMPGATSKNIITCESVTEEDAFSPFSTTEVKELLEKRPEETSLKTYFGSKTGEAVLGNQSAMVVSPISTPEYARAVERGQVPFVLFQPCKGPPVIVKVRSLAGDKHLLVPTSAKDFKEKEKSAPETSDVSHFQVPIVALIHQKVEPSGQIMISVASPSSNMGLGYSSHYEQSEIESAEHIIVEEHMLYVSEEGDILAIE